MSVRLSPIFVGQQFFNAAGNVLAGGRILQFLAGTTTPQSTFTDNTGVTPNANPIILDSAGRYSNQIWFTQGVTYKLQLQDSGSNILLTEDNLSGVNDTGAVSTSEWVAQNNPTYVSGTSFTMAGDQRAVFAAGVRVKAQINAGSIYGTVSSSVFGASTTVTLVNDSGSLDNTLSAVSVGFLGETNPSVPAIIPYNSIAFFAYLSADQTSGSTAIFDMVFFQNGGTNYSNSTGLFTAPFKGIYQFNCTPSLGNTSGGTWSNVISFYPNATILAANLQNIPNAQTVTAPISATISLSAGQTCGVVNSVGGVLTAFSATKRLSAGAAGTCQFSGHMVTRTG